MRFDHTKFFDGFKPFYKTVTGLNLDTDKVQALDFLLTKFEADPLWTRTTEIGYALATIHIETFIPKTGQRYEPIKEFGGKAYFIKRYWTNTKIRKQLGNLSEYDAWARCGRGYVQETGLANDKKFTKLLNIDLINNPELALDPDTAFDIMTVGMFNGIFTGKKLGPFIDKGDLVNARTVINGHDRAQEIAGYAHSITKILDSALAPDVAEDDSSTSKGDAPTDDKDSVKIVSSGLYNGIGFIPTIKQDLAAVTGGNIGMQAVGTAVDRISGLPPWATALAYKVGIILIIASVAYLLFRVGHYIIFEISDNRRRQMQATANTSNELKNIIWTKSGNT